MEYSTWNYSGDVGSMSQNTGTTGSQNLESSHNAEYNFNDNEQTLFSGVSNSELYSTQYSGVQNDSYTDAAFQTSFEGGSTPRPTVDSLGWTMNSPNMRLYSFRVRKSKEPYFELKSPWFPTSETPGKIYLEPAKNPKKGEYPCLYPWGCMGKQSIFSRPADLERHYRNVHGEIEDKDTFACDYQKCEKSWMPFTRKDHLRDHFRDFHKEDIGAVKGSGRAKETKKRLAIQKTWNQERVVKPDWWRCPRCLVKIYVASNGWECQQCKITCEQERQDARMKLPNTEATKAIDKDTDLPDYDIGSLGCDACDNNGWVLSGMDWVACQCQQGM